MPSETINCVYMMSFPPFSTSDWGLEQTLLLGERRWRHPTTTFVSQGWVQQHIRHRRQTADQFRRPIVATRYGHSPTRSVRPKIWKRLACNEGIPRMSWFVKAVPVPIKICSWKANQDPPKQQRINECAALSTMAASCYLGEKYHFQPSVVAASNLIVSCSQ